jgi:hypothetical protein
MSGVSEVSGKNASNYAAGGRLSLIVYSLNLSIRQIVAKGLMFTGTESLTLKLSGLARKAARGRSNDALASKAVMMINDNCIPLPSVV